MFAKGSVPDAHFAAAGPAPLRAGRGDLSAIGGERETGEGRVVSRPTGLFAAAADVPNRDALPGGDRDGHTVARPGERRDGRAVREFVAFLP